METIANATFLGPVGNLKEEKTKTGKPMLSFTLKTVKEINGQKVALYHTIVAYSASAEAMRKYLHDGKVVFVDCDISKSISPEERYQFVVKRFSFL